MSTRTLKEARRAIEKHNADNFEKSSEQIKLAVRKAADAKAVVDILRTKVHRRDFRRMTELRCMLTQPQIEKIESVEDLLLAVENLFENPSLWLIGVSAYDVLCDYGDVRRLVLGYAWTPRVDPEIEKFNNAVKAKMGEAK